MSATGTLSTDEQRLAELGYKQELKRGWSGFSNFAISFSIISVLAGCFTTYGQAFKNGGPIAISIMWPLISVLILMVAFSMSELASAMPTAGGIYYWASKLGGAGWGWFTGWFNLIGLIAVVASVDYVCATFLMNLLGLYNVHFIFKKSLFPRIRLSLIPDPWISSRKKSTSVPSLRPIQLRCMVRTFSGQPVSLSRSSSSSCA